MHSVCGGGEFSFGKCLCNAGVVVMVLVVDGYLVCLEECGVCGDWFLFGTGGGVAVVLFFLLFCFFVLAMVFLRVGLLSKLMIGRKAAAADIGRLGACVVQLIAVGVCRLVWGNRCSLFVNRA